MSARDEVSRGQPTLSVRAAKTYAPPAPSPACFMSDTPAVQRIESIVESEFGLDGGAMFGIIPKPLWERTNPADDRNRIAMTARCLYLEVGDRCVLVDTGMGDKWGAKEQDIYHVRHPRGGLRTQLESRGIDADSITDVVLTHLHFDHAGGTTRMEGDRLVPTLPTATHWVQRKHWVWAHNPSIRDGGSFRPENFAVLGTPDGPPLELVDGHATLFPGVEVIVSDGHTPGMQMVKCDVGGQTVVFTADLLPTAGHVQVPYVMGYDVAPLTTCAEKAELLKNAVQNDWVLALDHDPNDGFVRVERDARGRYAVARRGSLSDL